MLTLKKTKDTIQIASLVQNKKKTSVFWHPTIDDELMNNVSDLNSFNSSHFRDRFELSALQATEIFNGLTAEEVVENNQAKYFKVKRHITKSLLSEMNISDTSGVFQIDFEPNPLEYTHHMLICGGTNSGKTWFAVQQILRNLDGPKAQKRHFLIISSEWDEDSTLKPLKNEKYQQFVRGIDVSENSLRDSEWNTKEDSRRPSILINIS